MIVQARGDGGLIRVVVVEVVGGWMEDGETHPPQIDG